jgi:zinc ribbon protein
MGLMFCRYCGAHIQEDSIFCDRCGKRLDLQSGPKPEPQSSPKPDLQFSPKPEPQSSPKLDLQFSPKLDLLSSRKPDRQSNHKFDKIASTLKLNTPYPYAIILFALVASYFGFQPKKTFDYSHTKWSIEMDRKLDVPDDNMYRDSLSLIVENTGTTTLRGIPVELQAKIEPAKKADVAAAFPSDKELLIREGKPQPVDIILSDSIPAGSKRRFALDGSVQAIPPFKATFIVLKDDAKTVLTSYVLER